ncbi:hypothetical protein [Aeromonas dhakensis]|uniref:hypothetical protein n=1 Tax=Aeromonas dhakensis TaxID=196024 RepID=UPI001F5D6DE3|nr:hypothetical protein [Aeromonas dhakensis]
MADFVLGLLAALGFAAAPILTTSATPRRLGCRLIAMLAPAGQRLLALGPFDGLLFEADMVTDEPVQLVQLGAGFLLSPEQRLHPAGDGILYRFFVSRSRQPSFSAQ